MNNYREYIEDKVFHIISDEAGKLGVRAFVIGGYVRDCFLKRPSKDIDIVVEGSGIELAQNVGQVLHSKVSVFKSFGTAMISIHGIDGIKDGLEIEFVGARKESYRRNSRKPIVENGTLKEDQERRDFTINALALSLQNNKDDEHYGDLVDPFNGIKDLNNKIIKTPLNPDTTYSDDPLRMIRAIRFASQLGFKIVPESIRSIKRNKERLEILSVERISEEMNKILLSPKPSIGLNLLYETGLLNIFFPLLCKLAVVENIDGQGHKDNFAHTLAVVDNVAKVSDNLWLRWAALLHDIAKSSTKRYEEGIGWTFHGHEFVGSKMIPGIFKQFKLPLNDKMKYVQKMVLLHLRPISLVQSTVTDSAVRRLLFDAGEDIDDLMILCGADITSKNDKTVARNKRNFELVKKKMVEVEEKDAVRNFKNPISGEMIMSRYNIAPCREIGLIKDYIKNAILDGVIPNDYDAALKLMDEKAVEMGIAMNK